MTPEREAEIRRLVAEYDFPTSAELLAELDRLRAAAEGMGIELRETVAAGDPDRYACDKAFMTVLKRGRELGLWK